MYMCLSPSFSQTFSCLRRYWQKPSVAKWTIFFLWHSYKIRGLCLNQSKVEIWALLCQLSLDLRWGQLLILMCVWNVSLSPLLLLRNQTWLRQLISEQSLWLLKEELCFSQCRPYYLIPFQLMGIGPTPVQPSPFWVASVFRISLLDI